MGGTAAGTVGTARVITPSLTTVGVTGVMDILAFTTPGDITPTPITVGGTGMVGVTGTDGATVMATDGAPQATGADGALDTSLGMTSDLRTTTRTR